MDYDFDFPYPDMLQVTLHSDKPVGESIDTVWLDALASNDLACFLLPKMEKLTNTECAKRFWGQLLGGVMSIARLPTQHYMPVYHAIIEACDKIDSLTPYKDALNKALRADPRFQEKQTA